MQQNDSDVDELRSLRKKVQTLDERVKQLEAEKSQRTDPITGKSVDNGEYKRWGFIIYLIVVGIIFLCTITFISMVR